MRTISYRAEDLKKVVIELGFVGENEHTQVIIDCTKTFAEYPEAVPTMKVQPPKGTAYPRTVTREGNCVIWTVMDGDLAERGRGEIQLTFTKGTKICKTYVGKTNISRSIVGSGPVPSGIQDFLDDANEALQNLEAAEVHQPIIDDNGYWNTWNQETGEYEATSTKAQGEDGQDGTDATPDLITVPYEDLTFPVAAGTQCYHDGKLYQANQAIQSSEQWTAAHWTETTVEAQITDVKNAFHSNINNDTALKNYSLGAYDTGRNIGPMVTFVDDDNNVAFADFWPAIITAKEIPMSMAVIVGKVGNQYYGTWDDLKNYHDNYGVEMLCHTYSHLTETTDYSEMTVDEIAENEFARAKRILEEHGYKTDFLMYPGASSDALKVRLAAVRTFPVAVCAGGSEINITPLAQHNIKRYSLGHNDGQTIDLDTYKALVDEAVAKNGWLIFMSHSQYNCMTSASAEVIKSLIDYIRSVGADIVNMRQGYSRFANVVNVEDGSVRDGGFKVGADGKFKNTTGIGSGLATKQIHNFYSKVSSYENLNVTEERIMTNAKLFPRTAYGILRSYRTDTNLVQWFMPYGYQELWVRKIKGDNLPAEFTCQTIPTGTYDDRNSRAQERKGNCYYDETNNRPIFCKTAGKRTVDKLTVTHGASASGNVKITYAFGSKEVAVEAGDTAEEVAEKIASASLTGHNIIQCAEDPLILYITRLLAGSTSALSFSDTGLTGVTATVNREVTGSSAEWVDAAGNTL